LACHSFSPSQVGISSGSHRRAREAIDPSRDQNIAQNIGRLRSAKIGLRVPRDLSVVGFDDVPEAQWAVPALTTIRQPIAEMSS